MVGHTGKMAVYSSSETGFSTFDMKSYELLWGFGKSMVNHSTIYQSGSGAFQRGISPLTAVSSLQGK